ncbi:MAG: ADP-forming succinate--CoA ligase subunit beta [Alphaproteobacteria bacterium]|nr:ADP-forming succinate--CoA ligase subunit beta [Alphaproteobacteria bacterium]
MNIHEHQAKDLLRQYGINIPEGKVIFNTNEIEPAIASFNAPVLIVKAQIHAGGRGKGGGVRVAKTPADAITYAQSMLGMNLVTKQTGITGKHVQRVYIEPGVNIKKELYLSFVIDRTTSHITIIASTEGGMDIEEVAEKYPDKIIKVSINPITGFQPFHGRQLTIGLNLPINAKDGIGSLCQKLFKLFVEKDLAMLEINPLVITSDDTLIPLDAKISFDDNALFRHPDIQALRDLTEEDPKEIEASKFDLNYVSLDGNIGCMVNGAGLAMATMDIIKLHGGEPANFLDVGGGATKEKVQSAFKIILSDPAVKGILVNIFGGIMRCDVIAQGIVDAAHEMEIHVPVVVRLQGTNVELGKDILARSNLNLHTVDSLTDAATSIVNAVKG